MIAREGQEAPAIPGQPLVSAAKEPCPAGSVQVNPALGLLLELELGLQPRQVELQCLVVGGSSRTWIPSMFRS